MNTTVKCPTCNKVTTWEGNPWRPFCSERCKLIDLGDWASEKHRIPGPATHHQLDEDSDTGSDLNS